MVKIGHLHWGWSRWFRGGGWRASGPPCSPQHLTWADAVADLGRAPEIVFSVVRDPAARLQSEWRWQRRNPDAGRCARAVARLPFHLWLPLALAIAARQPYAFDNHMRPQSEFIPAHATVFRLEDGLQPALDWAATALDITAGEVPRVLRTGSSAPVGRRELAWIAATYRNDFDRFGYDLPSNEAADLPLWAKTLAAPMAALVPIGRLS